MQILVLRKQLVLLTSPPTADGTPLLAITDLPSRPNSVETKLAELNATLSRDNSALRSQVELTQLQLDSALSQLEIVYRQPAVKILDAREMATARDTVIRQGKHVRVYAYTVNDPEFAT